MKLFIFVRRMLMLVAFMATLGSLTATAAQQDKKPCKNPNRCYRVAWVGHGHGAWTSKENAQSVLAAVRIGTQNGRLYWIERKGSRLGRAKKGL
jgi:hypothetical protein